MLVLAILGLLGSPDGYRVNVGAASVYFPGDGHCGTHKADGSRFTKKDAHIAHRRIALGTPGFACSVRTGRCVRTIVRDRGPYGSKLPCNKDPSQAKGIGKPKLVRWGKRKSSWKVCYWWQAQVKLQPGWKRRGSFDLTRPVAKAIGHRGFDKVVFFYRRKSGGQRADTQQVHTVVARNAKRGR